MNYSERLMQLIEIIRKMPVWKKNTHAVISFPNGEVGYYDADKGQEYFRLKYKDVDLCHFSSTKFGIEISFANWATFYLDKWIKELEDIIVIEDNFIVINGKKYKVLPIEPII